MRKIIILIIILFVTLHLNSQDFEPIQSKFYFNDVQDSVLINANKDRFKQTYFLKGWHWDCKKKSNPLETAF